MSGPGREAGGEGGCAGDRAPLSSVMLPASLSPTSPTPQLRRCWGRETGSTQGAARCTGAEEWGVAEAESVGGGCGAEVDVCEGECEWRRRRRLV